MKNDTNDWWQPALFEKNTRHMLPPELEVLEGPPPENENYNCFIYVLGLASDPDVIKNTSGFIYDNFIEKLLEVGELNKTSTPEEGDYVVYQDLENYPEHLTHGGVLEGDKVVSKWAWGPLVRHRLWDVPKEYGDTVFYIKAITPQKACELFNQYCEANHK